MDLFFLSLLYLEWQKLGIVWFLLKLFLRIVFENTKNIFFMLYENCFCSLSKFSVLCVFSFFFSQKKKKKTKNQTFLIVFLVLFVFENKKQFVNNFFILTLSCVAKVGNCLVLIF